MKWLIEVWPSQADEFFKPIKIYQFYFFSDTLMEIMANVGLDKKLAWEFMTEITHSKQGCRV